MSLIFTLKGNSSTLTIDLVNPIQLDIDSDYGIALIGFHSYNSIPNIEEGKKFYYWENNDKNKEEVIINFPAGSYEISDIEDFLLKQIVSTATDEENLELEESGFSNENLESVFSLKPNNNTLKCEIYSSDLYINFVPSDSIGSILGFSKKLLPPGEVHSSDLPVNIVKVRTIHIDCNLTTGAFYNDRPSHTIYEFAVNDNPGFAIDELPKNLLYLPIIQKRDITNITLNILDQNFQPVNFRGEEIIVRLELRKLK